MIIGKYYPKFFTQFIIGCSCYVITFIILKDFISKRTYEKYKYYILSLIAVDISYLIYQAKTSGAKEKNTQQNKNITDAKTPEQSTTDAASSALTGNQAHTGSAQSVTLSSEVNDFRVTHDLSSSDNNYSLFSSENEKSENEKSENEKSENEKSPVKKITSPVPAGNQVHNLAPINDVDEVITKFSLSSEST